MAQVVGTPAPSRIQREWREWLLFIALAGPNLLLFVIFNYRPLVYNAYLSFHEWDFLVAGQDLRRLRQLRGCVHGPPLPPRRSRTPSC